MTHSTTSAPLKLDEQDEKILPEEITTLLKRLQGTVSVPHGVLDVTCPHPACELRVVLERHFRQTADLVSQARTEERATERQTNVMCGCGRRYSISADGALGEIAPVPDPKGGQD